MDEEIKNVQNEDGINEETAEETTANAEAEEEPIGNIKISVDVVSTIDLYIVVDYGVRIPELSWEIQENVKNSVETMTGLDVQKVNIHIEGVSFEKEKEEKIELDSNVNETPLPTVDTDEDSMDDEDIQD